MATWYDIASSPDRYVRVGSGGAIEINDDPSAFDNVWLAQASGISDDLYGVAWNGFRFVAVGEGGVGLTSPDGLAPWTAVTTGAADDLNAITAAGNVLIAVGNGGVIRISQNGLAWEALASGTTFDLWDVTAANGEYIAVGDNDVIVTGPITSTLFDIILAPTIGMHDALDSTGIFNVTVNETIQFDDLAHRQTFAPTPILVAVTEHLSFEDDGETDVGGAVESGFDETTTNLDVTVTETLRLDEVNQGQYQGDVAETFFMFLNDEVALSSVQSTDQWIGNASGVDSFTLNDRPFINNELLQDSFGLADTLTAYYHFHLVEALGLSAVLTDAAAYQDVLEEALALSDATAANGTFQITVLDDLSLGDSLSLNQIFEVIVTEGLSFTVSVTLDGEAFVAWVVNTETLGTTQYANYGFQSFCEIDGEYFATDGEAIYRLSGDDDAGASIDAEISLGATDFGSAYQKGIQDVFLGLSTDGKMIVKVVTDEKVEDWYELDTSETTIHGTKVKTGRGLKARYYRFKLRNKQGADFELDSIRMVPVSTGRRVK